VDHSDVSLDSPSLPVEGSVQVISLNRARPFGPGRKKARLPEVGKLAVRFVAGDGVGPVRSGSVPEEIGHEEAFRVSRLSRPDGCRSNS
jgi:hypothetical protein